MSDYLKKIIFDFLYFKTCNIADTEWFKFQKHNKHLVPAFNTKVCDIIDSFEKYHFVSYDTQSVMDHGVDVVTRYEVSSGADSQIRYIGFQIKSYNDIQVTDWLTKLKAQAQDAKTNFNLEDYYIILCTSVSEHLDKIRSAAAAFSKDESTHIVEPKYAREFLRLSPLSIGAYLKAKLSEEDLVFRQAYEELFDLTPQQASILIELVVSSQLESKHRWDIEELRNRTFIQSVYANVPNLPSWYYNSDRKLYHSDERDNPLSSSTNINLAQDLDILAESFVDLSTTDCTVSVIFDSLTALAALSLDGLVRYNFKHDHLKKYLLETLLEEKLRMAADFMDTIS